MARLVVKKLPAGWLFVPSRRQVRQLLADLGADVRLVEFFGTASGGTLDWISLGFVESRVVEGSWRIYLRLWGVREAIIGPVQEELAAMAVAEMRRYIRACAGQSPAAVRKPAQMSLAFRVSGEGIASACRVRAVDRRSFPTPAGWESEVHAEAGPAADRGLHSGVPK
jgi:hypothetical protein